MSLFTKDKQAAQSDEHWIPLSDLMSGLMMLFMLIAVMYIIEHRSIVKVQKCEAKILQENIASVKRITEVYEKAQKELRDALEERLRAELKTWDARLEDDLTIRFSERSANFKIGDATLPPRFREILSQFIPQYIEILYEERFRPLISEIRIEGHTSSEWSGRVTPEVAYMRNMELSQGRTRATLEYALTLPRNAEQQKWLVSRLTANGLSSSRLIVDENGKENAEASKRVEFRVRTNAETQLLKVIQTADGDWIDKLARCRESGGTK